MRLDTTSSASSAYASRDLLVLTWTRPRSDSGLIPSVCTSLDRLRSEENHHARSLKYLRFPDLRVQYQREKELVFVTYMQEKTVSEQMPLVVRCAVSELTAEVIG